MASPQITGTLSHDSFMLRQGTLTESNNYPGTTWCTKTDTLRFRRLNGTDSLNGILECTGLPAWRNLSEPQLARTRQPRVAVSKKITRTLPDLQRTRDSSAVGCSPL
jgi:hypothetical protein